MLDLVPQAAVKVNDVAVGRVESITLPKNGWTANVTMLINGDVHLPANATASLQQTSLLGEKYIELAPPATGANGTLINNATIPLTRTNRNPEVEEVFGALSLLLNGGGIGQLQTITRQLNSALGGNVSSIRSMLINIDKLVNNLDDHKQDITDALDGINQLAGTLASRDQQIGNVLQNLAPGLQILDQQRQQLVTMLDSLNTLSGVAIDTVNKSEQDMVADLQALAPTLRQLANAGAALPQALQVMFTYPFTDAVLDGTKGSYLNLYLTINAQTLLMTPGRRRRLHRQAHPRRDRRGADGPAATGAGQRIAGPARATAAAADPVRKRHRVAPAHNHERSLVEHHPAEHHHWHDHHRHDDRLPVDHDRLVDRLVDQAAAIGHRTIRYDDVAGRQLMLSTATRVKIVAFLVIGLTVIVYIGLRYADLGRYVGLPGYYVVHVDLAQAGGAFPNGDVTYRGVTVGKIGAINLSQDGVVADLDINDSAPRIPAQVQAVVADRSAVGEQYIDLRPKTGNGPYLSAGDTIPQQDTQTPLPVQDLLQSIDGLAASVPDQSLRTVVDELDNAFQGQGPNLQTLLDTSSSLTKAATDDLPATQQLINDSQTVLRTQSQESDALRGVRAQRGTDRTAAGQIRSGPALVDRQRARRRRADLRSVAGQRSQPRRPDREPDQPRGPRADQGNRYHRVPVRIARRDRGGFVGRHRRRRELRSDPDLLLPVRMHGRLWRYRSTEQRQHHTGPDERECLLRVVARQRDQRARLGRLAARLLAATAGQSTCWAMGFGRADQPEKSAWNPLRRVRENTNRNCHENTIFRPRRAEEFLVPQ